MDWRLGRVSPALSGASALSPRLFSLRPSHQQDRSSVPTSHRSIVDSISLLQESDHSSSLILISSKSKHLEDGACFITTRSLPLTWNSKLTPDYGAGRGEVRLYRSCRATGAKAPILCNSHHFPQLICHPPSRPWPCHFHWPCLNPPFPLVRADCSLKHTGNLVIIFGLKHLL